MESKLRPKVVLWWGIGLTVAGVLSTDLLPQLGYAIAFQPSAANGVDQGLMTLLALVVRIIEQIVAPIGVVLIGAGVMMAYVDRRLAVQAAEPEHSTFD